MTSAEKVVAQLKDELIQALRMPGLINMRSIKANHSLLNMHIISLQQQSVISSVRTSYKSAHS